MTMPVSVPYRGATFLNTIPATPIPVWDELGDCGGKVILLKCSRFESKKFSQIQYLSHARQNTEFRAFKNKMLK